MPATSSERLQAGVADATSDTGKVFNADAQIQNQSLVLRGSAAPVLGIGKSISHLTSVYASGVAREVFCATDPKGPNRKAPIGFLSAAPQGPLLPVAFDEFGVVSNYENFEQDYASFPGAAGQSDLTTSATLAQPQRASAYPNSSFSYCTSFRPQQPPNAADLQVYGQHRHPNAALNSQMDSDATLQEAIGLS